MIKLNTVYPVEGENPGFLRWYNRRRVVTPVGESVTDTSFGNDTDVNNIVARFKRTGEMPEPTQEPCYQDVTGLQGDLTELLAKAEEVREHLEALQQHEAAEKAAKEAQDRADLEQFRKQQALTSDQPASASEPTGE